MSCCLAGSAAYCHQMSLFLCVHTYTFVCSYVYKLKCHLAKLCTGVPSSVLVSVR